MENHTEPVEGLPFSGRKDKKVIQIAEQTGAVEVAEDVMHKYSQTAAEPLLWASFLYS